MSDQIKTDYTREELIQICERAIVPVKKWSDRDSPSAHEKLGVCLVMLKAGASFSVNRTAREGERGCFTDQHTIWLTLHWPDFNDFEYGTRSHESASDTFYIPTPARLDAAAGEDWY